MTDDFRSLLKESIKIDGFESAKQQWERGRSEREQYLNAFQITGVNSEVIEEIRQNFQTIENELLYPERNKNKGSISGWVWILVIVAVVGVGIVGWFWYRKRKK